MSNLVEQIRTAMADDDDDQSERLRDQYNAATPEIKAALDEAFISLCGWSMKTLIERDDDPQVSDTDLDEDGEGL